MKFLIQVAVLVVTALALSLGLNWLTLPPAKLEADAGASSRAAGADRSIPLTRVTAENNGDPNNILTPIYPTSPGKDLPPKPATMTKAEAADQKPTETDGRASSDDVSMSPAKTAMLPTAVSAGASNACNIPACESAYRSFRAEDCSYQPYDGPRRLCAIGNESTAQAGIAPPPASTTPVSAVASDHDGVEWRPVARGLRPVPMPEADDDSDDYWRGGYGEEPPPRASYRRGGYWIDVR